MLAHEMTLMEGQQQSTKHLAHQPQTVWLFIKGGEYFKSSCVKREMTTFYKNCVWKSWFRAQILLQFQIVIIGTYSSGGQAFGDIISAR